MTAQVMRLVCEPKRALTRARLNLIIDAAIRRGAREGVDPLEYVADFVRPRWHEVVALIERTNPRLHCEIVAELAARKRLQ